MRFFPSDALDTWADMLDIQTVGTYVYEHPRALVQLGQRALKRYQQYLQLWSDFRQFQVALETDAADSNVQWSQELVQPASVGHFDCHLCSATFGTYKSLCTHVFKQHGLANIAHRFAIGNQCRACLKVYHDRDRLVHHLKYYRTGCLLKLSVTVAPLTDEALADLSSDQQAAKHSAKRRQRAGGHVWPVTQAAGPLRPWPWQRQLSQRNLDHRSTRPDLPDDQSAWVSTVLETLHTEDSAAVFHVLNRIPYHGTYEQQLLHAFAGLTELFDTHEVIEQHLTLQEAVELWRSNALLVPHDSVLPMSIDNVRITLQAIRIPQHSSLPPSQGFDDRRTELVSALWAECDVPTQLQKQIAREHAKKFVFPPVPPRVFTQKPVYLYVFSGHRRIGDYQAHMEALFVQHQCHGHILLLDLALSPSHDVTNPALVSTMMTWIRTGHIAALLVAPPCETWSEVRYQPVDDHSSPRPIRTAQNPLCIPGLRHDELSQLRVANFLLFVAVRLLWAAATSGVPGIAEHPRPSKHADRASIWRLPWLMQLQQSGLLRFKLIWQAQFGARAAKPTYFAICHVVGFDSLRKEMAQTVDWANLELLKGKRSDGSWMTAAAKEYPPLLNCFLARCHLQSVIHLRTQTPAVCPTDPQFDHQFAQLYSGDVDMAQQCMQPDYGKHVHLEVRAGLSAKEPGSEAMGGGPPGVEPPWGAVSLCRSLRRHMRFHNSGAPNS
eukprot:Skav223612  [mRNA]  locus=scaffold1522:66967:69546:- [translate_table: standard]